MYKKKRADIVHHVRYYCHSSMEIDGGRGGGGQGLLIEVIDQASDCRSV